MTKQAGSVFIIIFGIPQDTVTALRGLNILQKAEARLIRAVILNQVPGKKNEIGLFFLQDRPDLVLPLPEVFDMQVREVGHFKALKGAPQRGAFDPVVPHLDGLGVVVGFGQESEEEKSDKY